MKLIDWKEKVVAVSGGSKGLGLEISRSFGNRNAQVVVLASTEESLESCSKELSGDGVKVASIKVDVREADSVQAGFEQIRSEFGRLDVLVNAVGKSTRADICNLDLEESSQLMDLNYFSALRCTKFALPDLIASKGHLVNIGSLSSKTAWPFMTPYTASKFALAALTHQLRIELRDQIHAMLVCPGPIRRSDSGSRYDSEASTLPESARKPGGGAKVKGVCPQKLAEKIVRGCERRKSELIVPFKANLLFTLSSLSTRLGDWLGRLSRKD